MKCQRCGNKYHKKYLDTKGLCKDCSEDLSFKLRMNILSKKEWDNIQKENEFWDNIESNTHKYDFIPVSIMIMIFVTIFLCGWDNAPNYSFFIIILSGFLSVFAFGLGIEIIKPIWIYFAKLLDSYTKVKVFTVSICILIAIIGALIVAI